MQAAPAAAKMESEGMGKNSTLICAPLMADSVHQMLVAMNKAKSSGADLVEVRLDSLKSFNPSQDVETLVKRCPLPTLFTYRFGNAIERWLFLCNFGFNFIHCIRN